MGCFAKGCLTVLILGCILVVGVGGSIWFVYHKLATNLISDAPAAVRLEQPSEAQFRAAESSLARVKSTSATGREMTVAFTAADLNALLAREPDFQDLENRARIEIQNSAITITLSAPLDSLPWPTMKGRWFNGSLRFSGAYESGMFRINLASATAGDYELPSFFLSNVNSWINRGVNESLDDWEKDEFGTEFWKHIKSIRLEGDKLVVTTQPE
jgi:hypothetical protein